MLDIEAELERSPASVNALKVVKRLTSEGFEAYLVGGCVRDLMLGKSPKDYDVATNALPEEVKDLFRNSRLIGRRFKIVHVRYGREIIEVTTFRAPHSELENEEQSSDSGQLLTDNIYGDFEEDVYRRDFTMNALYYDADLRHVEDLVEGTADIEAKTIRLIGDPEKRFREDPVRMLRAIRFRAKLCFDIEPKTAKPIKKFGFLLGNIPPARLFEEVLKLFLSGHAEKSFDALMEYDLFGWLFPDSQQCFDNPKAAELIRLALQSTDRRIANDQPVTPAFIFAALLWYPFINEREKLIEDGMPAMPAFHEASGNVLTRQQHVTSIPKRFSGPMRDIWQIQGRLPQTGGKKPSVLRSHKRFRAAYDFLLLREESGEMLDDIGKWWTQYQLDNPVEGGTTSQRQPEPEPEKKRRRRRRPRKKPAPSE